MHVLSKAFVIFAKNTDSPGATGQRKFNNNSQAGLQEKEIQLPPVDQRELYGPNNSKFRLIKEAFPKLKIIARGDSLKVLGEPAEIERFELAFEQILTHLDTYLSLPEKVLTSLLGGEESPALNRGNSDEVLVHGPGGIQVKARTENQKRMVTASAESDMVFAIGPAGTGKSYTAVALAVRALKARQVRRIILTRPAVEAGENLGFLPGDLKEKLDPYLQPLYDALMDMLPYEKLADHLEKGIIEIAPLAFMRGRTLDHAYVILDEAQNATTSQMKMFLTRMGQNAKFIITGDMTQIDLPKKQTSGLAKAVQILEKVEGIAVIRLNEKDVIRHRLVTSIIKAFEEEVQEDDKKETRDHRPSHE